jgi:uncharacterized membrane protein YfcA
MANTVLYVLLGLAAGALSGLIGIGGGVIIVPALILFFGLSQHEAQGTTLALLIPPVGILAVWTYYKQGYVNLGIAGYMCVGFLVGSFLGAKMATNISNVVLEKIFGVALLLIAVKMLLTK